MKFLRLQNKQKKGKNYIFQNIFMTVTIDLEEKIHQKLTYLHSHSLMFS